VVEDDVPTRELLAAILRTEGIEHRLSSNGHEAMEQAHSVTPALVVLDMHLPSVQGDAVATALRIDFGHRLPVLAMSASLEAGLAERLGAYAYLQKPFEVEDFVQLVRRGLELAVLNAAAHTSQERMEAALRRQREAFDRARTAGPDVAIREPASGDRAAQFRA